MVLDSAGRLLQSLAPRKEKQFCPFAEFFLGNLKSVSVLRMLLKEHAEFLVKRLHRYCGAKSLSNLKTIALDSLCSSNSIKPVIRTCDTGESLDPCTITCYIYYEHEEKGSLHNEIKKEQSLKDNLNIELTKRNR